MNRFFKISMISFFICCEIIFLSYFLNPASLASSETLPIYSYEVIHVYHHDPDAFTQGLVYENGFLYEGTGLYEHSSLRKVELKTGKVLQVREVPDWFFCEGVTIFKNKIFQLTWQSKIGFVYDKNSFNLLKEFHYSYEGWGITHDGKCLIISDGTSIIHFLNPDTFEEIRQIDVHENDISITRINELEYIKGEIYANIWQTDRIARIDPLSGQILGWIDLKGILNDSILSKKVDVLNGIAYDAINERLFVTGKFWPNIFEIKLIKK